MFTYQPPLQLATGPFSQTTQLISNPWNYSAPTYTAPVSPQWGTMSNNNYNSWNSLGYSAPSFTVNQPPIQQKREEFWLKMAPDYEDPEEKKETTHNQQKPITPTSQNHNWSWNKWGNEEFIPGWSTPTKTDTPALALLNFYVTNTSTQLETTLIKSNTMAPQTYQPDNELPPPPSPPPHQATTTNGITVSPRADAATTTSALPIYSVPLSLLPENANTSKVLDRSGNEYFQCGCSSMSGRRPMMEDAHSTYFGPQFSIFGVYDGHNGAYCAQFLSKHFGPTLSSTPFPISDESIEQLCFYLDKAYCESTADPSGSTAAFVVAVPNLNKEKYELHVGNIGDARVLVGRQDGRVCLSLTEDHKPDNELERRRIYMCGGSVVNGRVDGALAVSRAFGDQQFKTGPNPLFYKVTAQPDIMQTTCKPDDFIIIACDGIFEAGFSNQQVVRYVGEQLKKLQDPALVATALIDEAYRRGSGDNLTAMVVLFKDGQEYNTGKDFLPGPLISSPPTSRRVYYDAAKRAGCSVAESLEKRYLYLQELSKSELNTTDRANVPLQAELSQLTPPPDMRSNWFEQLAEMISLQ